ncbi:General transcription factor II-I repeat domain-containing protein 2B [Acipenser ruthenus]|uniref:General transcription factor II-I repeat domain-containing protein 2B n=1 Tax=Acipenser ruthenus TaxID=7906 RepID=A0A662YTG2_ACIRT|nr:General transcription factor II-I repeat domain-containing protein 2B [Acipenser ruthenus]
MLGEAVFVLDLAFITDVTVHFNALNLTLQGKDTTLMEMLSAVKSFKAKLQFFKDDVPFKDFTHFPQLLRVTNENQDLKEQFPTDVYTEHITELERKFDSRFTDNLQFESAFTFLDAPFQQNVRETVSSLKPFYSDKAAVSLELLEFQNVSLQQCYKFSNKSADFWLQVPREKYQCLASSSLKILVCSQAHTYVKLRFP